MFKALTFSLDIVHRFCASLRGTMGCWLGRPVIPMETSPKSEDQALACAGYTGSAHGGKVAPHHAALGPAIARAISSHARFGLKRLLLLPPGPTNAPFIAACLLAVMSAEYLGLIIRLSARKSTLESAVEAIDHLLTRLPSWISEGSFSVPASFKLHCVHRFVP